MDIARNTIFLLVTVCCSTSYGQVVQLPTFQQFSIGTAVVIPDRGAAYLGGVNRARYGSVTHGVPLFGSLPGAGRLGRNRAIHSELSGAHAFATATIHDFEAMDRALLAGKPKAVRRTEDPRIAKKAAFLARHIGRRTPAKGDRTARRWRERSPNDSVPKR